MMSKSIKYLCIILLLSCANNEKHKPDTPPKLLVAQSESRIYENILDPTDFSIIDTTLLIIEEKLEDAKFKFIDANNNFEILTTFGKRGKGPNEYSNNIAQPISNISSGEINIFDWSKKRLSLFEIDSSTNDFSLTKTREFTLPPQFMMAQQAAFINDSTTISVGGSSEGLVSFINVNTGAINYFNAIEHNVSKVKNVRNRGYLYDSFVAINSTNELIVVAPKFIPELYIIDFKGNIIHRNLLDPDFEIKMDFDIYDITSYFQDVTTSENYIYVSYFGKSSTEVDEILDNKDPRDINITKIMVFNWSGELIKTYLLKAGFYTQIAIDKFDTRIYSTNLIPTEGSGFVYFELE